MLSRVRGSMVAAVVGDCIGSIFESSMFVRMDEVLTAVKEMEQKKTRSAKQSQVILAFTDDTAMARSIAASIVDKKVVDVQDIAARFSKEFKEEPDRGYGGSVGTVLRALGDPNLQDLFEPARSQFNGSGSYGNGGGMRIAPLGLFCHDLPLNELKEKTVSITELTHTHPHAVVGALLESFAVQLALSLDNSKPLEVNSFLDQLLQRLKPVEKEIYDCDRERKSKKQKLEESQVPDSLPYCDKLEVIRDFLSRDVDTEEVDEKLGTGIAALESVPTAVYCFLKGAGKSIPGVEERNPVEQTILYAISLGGDTDTIATMAAAISGAFYGQDFVPQAWQDFCEGVEDAMQWGEKMVDIIHSREAARKVTFHLVVIGRSDALIRVKPQKFNIVELSSSILALEQALVPVGVAPVKQEC